MASLGIPAEIYLEIFSYLDPRQDKATLLSLRLTNRRIYDLATLRAFRFLDINISLENTLRKAALVSSNKTIANSIREMLVGKPGFTPSTPGLSYNLRSYSQNRTPDRQSRMACFFILVWNIIQNIDRPLEVFEISGRTDNSPNDVLLNADIAQETTDAVHEALVYTLINQLPKCPIAIIHDMHDSDAYGCSGTPPIELFRSLTGKGLQLSTERGNNTPRMAYHHRYTTSWLDKKRETVQFMSGSIRKPFKSFLPRLFRFVNIDMPSNFRLPYLNSTEMVPVDKNELSFEGIKPRSISWKNYYFSSNLSDLIPAFSFHTFLSNLRIELVRLYAWGYDFEPDNNWAMAFKTIRTSAMGLTGLYLRFLLYRNICSSSQLRDYPEVAIISRFQTDLDELRFLLDTVAERRLLMGLSKDPWLEAAKNTQLYPDGHTIWNWR